MSTAPHTDDFKIYFTQAYSGPPIGRCVTREHLVRDAIEGSAKLRDAIQRARG